MSSAALAKSCDEANDIAHIELDQSSLIRWNPKIQHERDVAVFDLLETNRFVLSDGPAGPYNLLLSLQDATLHFHLRDPANTDRQLAELALPVRPLRQVIKDYFLICESYFEAIKGAPPSRIETIDIARRGLHDEGAEQLADGLQGRVEMDHGTARRLFTLICVLHVRG